MPEMEKKMRLQLFDIDLNVLSDKVLGQERELMRGPKEPHDGPLKVEICLFDEKDIDTFIKYINRMRGHIPIVSVQPTKRSAKAPRDVEGFRHFMVNSLKDKEDPKTAIQVLRDNGFVFSSLDLLVDMGYPIAVSKIHAKSYKFMVRLMKKAKNPINDKYDPTLVVGFKDKKLVAYSGSEVMLELSFKEALQKDIKVPAKAKVKFPDYLVQDERNKFRAEMELLKADPDRKPSSFYSRWLSEVVKHSPLEINFPLADQIADAYEKGKTVGQVQKARREEKDSK